MKKFLLLGIWIFSLFFASCNADIYLIQGWNTNDITNYNWDIYLELWDNVSYSIDDSWWDDLMYNFTASCPSCPSTWEILSWYILESDITQWYCETQFDLISPEDCPSSWTWSWSGDIMWSSFWVNDRQILWGSNIYLYIPDWLDWSYTYVDQDLQVDVVNEGDEDYIEDILTVQSYHPSSEDFTVSFVWFLTLVLPYVIVALFCIFVFKIIKKIFK